jgi:hypothetical protein
MARHAPGFQLRAIHSFPRNSSTAREILQLKRDLEALKESMRPAKRWIAIEVGVGEDKSAEIAAIEAEGHHVLIQQIVRPKPVVMEADEPLPPELKLIADETAERRKRDAEEFESVTRPTQPEPERPFPLTYPRQVF